MDGSSGFGRGAVFVFLFCSLSSQFDSNPCFCETLQNDPLLFLKLFCNLLGMVFQLLTPVRTPEALDASSPSSAHTSPSYRERSATPIHLIVTLWGPGHTVRKGFPARAAGVFLAATFEWESSRACCQTTPRGFSHAAEK